MPPQLATDFGRNPGRLDRRTCRGTDRPSVIYAGTGEADMRSDIAQGIGMFRSEDGGDHWVSAGLADSQQIGRILVDPRDPRVLLVAALGHPYGPNATRGVFRSADGGRSWTRALFHDADTGAIDLAFRPGQPDVVYAALWQTRRPPWSVYPPSSGPGSGLYKSIDNGRSWTALRGHGLPDAPGRIGIATSPARPSRVYALIAGSQGGLFRSEDDGDNWAKISTDKRITERGWYFPASPPTQPTPISSMSATRCCCAATMAGRISCRLKATPPATTFTRSG